MHWDSRASGRRVALVGIEPEIPLAVCVPRHCGTSSSRTSLTAVVLAVGAVCGGGLRAHVA